MQVTTVARLGFVTFALGIFAGCGGSAQTMLPDGSQAYVIDCGGTARGLNYCFEKAGQSCGAAGYTIVGRDGQALSKSDVADSDMEALVREYEADPNSILIRCGT